jgi:hemolysin D
MSTRHRLEAALALFKRYGAIFLHFWKIRQQLGGGLFRVEEAEFLPAALAIQEKPASTTARLTGYILIAVVLFALLWSIIGKMDVVVNASGKVIPSEYTKTIAAVEVAVVRALHVQEGQQVKAGDVLIELDSSGTDAEHLKASGLSTEGALLVARSQALIEAIEHVRPPQLRPMPGVPAAQWQAAQRHLEGQYRDFATRLQRINGEIARYSEALPLAEQRANDYKLLKENGDVSIHAWLEKEQARVDLSGQLSDVRNQRASLISQMRKEAWDAMTEGRKLVTSNDQDANRAGERSRLLKLTAPVSGTVQQLAVHTVGSAVPAAQPLMVIVPVQNQLEVLAQLENKDIGFVEVGQHAEVKIDAYDYTRFGTIPAKVTHISRDAIQDEKKGLLYQVHVLLDKTALVGDGKSLPIGVGMSVNVEMKTAERRIIEYFLSPLLQHSREALRER